MPHRFTPPRHLTDRALSSLLLTQISWGTKEDSIPDTDLGAVIQDAQSKVDVEFFAEAADANALYEDSIQNLKHRTPVNKGPNKAGLTTAEKEQAAKEYYAGVRTNVLLAWVLSNVSGPFVLMSRTLEVDSDSHHLVCVTHNIFRRSCSSGFWAVVNPQTPSPEEPLPQPKPTSPSSSASSR